MEKQAYALVLYTKRGSDGHYGCESFEDAYQMKSDGSVKKILWTSYNPEQVMKAAYDANKTCSEMGIDCFDSDKEALYGEKVYENKKIRLTETELHEIVKSSVKQMVNEISYDMAKRAYQASTHRGVTGSLNLT